jgi:hypothetical protein
MMGPDEEEETEDSEEDEGFKATDFTEDTTDFLEPPCL